MSIADTDLVEVLRGGVSYKATGTQINDFLSPPAVPYSTTYLVVAGGGGGGAAYPNDWGGGGGAGGLLTGTVTLVEGATYSVTVGDGARIGRDGGNSSLSGTGITTVTTIGGGRGGSRQELGTAGGSGGGGGGTSETQSSGGSGTAGQGNAGGTGGTAGSGLGGGGGGGAGSRGQDMTEDASGNDRGGLGGSGIESSITGSSITYAIGGDGYAVRESGSNASGINGRGDGADAGEDNTENTTFGGSGVVILRVKTAYYTGITTGSPEITQVGEDTVIRFYRVGSGTYTS